MSLNRSFVFLRYPETHRHNPGNPDDYLGNPNAATKVVQALQNMGVKYFIVLAENAVEDYRPVATAIQAAGLQFFADQRWAWESAINEQEHFDSDKYLQDTIQPFLIPLKKEFPDTFVGFHFKDEPGLAHFDNLSDLKACLNKQPEFKEMKVFLNLLPIHANYASLSGLSPGLAGARPPSDFGVDCSNNSIEDMPRAKEMAKGYGTYARRATEKIRPDYLCFDLYPFSEELAYCNAARELTVSENLSIVSANAQLAGITPVAYIQNFQQNTHSFYANFHHLRWFTSWALAFGIREFGNFISHDRVIEDFSPDIGLLDSQNNETKLAGDQRSVFGFLRYIQYELIMSNYNRFVAPFIGVNSGDVVGWLPSQEVLAGEYSSGLANQAMIFFARRPIEGTVQTEVGLNVWYKTIEQLNVATGQWNLVARSLNSIQLTLDEFPGALYRLTK
jgi:hypothetical protein